jgi:hypothetical protein
MEPNFNLNRPPVSDEEINSKKDFGELVNKFKKQSIENARSDVSFLKNKKATYSAIIAGVAVVCTVTYFSVFKKEPPKENTHDKIITTNQSHTSNPVNKPSKAFVAPPISKLNVPYTSYKVKAEQGATIKHKSNSKIIIPKKAFVNKQGEDIVGDVEIRYREFHDQADIIAAGIPMGYDSAGVKSQLESAGMLDIRGYQDNEPVFIKPNKVITVEFASKHPDDRYNMYVLDTIARNWVYTGRDNSLVDQKKKQAGSQPAHDVLTPEKIETKKMIEIQEQLDAIPPKIETEKVACEKKISQLPKAILPSKPMKATTGRPQFQLDVNYKEFPELEAFKNAVFEVGTENKNYTSEFSKITWTSAEIAEGPQKGKNYLLILKQINKVEKLVVYPALTGANYDIALKTYESKFEDYKAGVVKREAAEKKLKEEFEAKQAAYVAEQKRLQAEMTQEQIRAQVEAAKQLNQQTAGMNNTQKVTRVFQVSQFGFCNSDCPRAFPKGGSIIPIFTVDGGKSFVQPNMIYLVSIDKNLIFTYDSNGISYNPDESYSVCVISKDKAYVCDRETFGRCVVNKQNKLPVKELDSYEDANSLRMALGI